MSDTNDIIEHLGDYFGLTVIYVLEPTYRLSVSFTALEITARTVDAEGNLPLYERKGAEVSSDHVTDPHEAEAYVRGSVKWDGCSHVNFGDENGYLHLCGAESWQKLADALPVIHRRCGEIMKAAGASILDDGFALTGQAEPPALRSGADKWACIGYCVVNGRGISGAHVG